MNVIKTLVVGCTYVLLNPMNLIPSIVEDPQLAIDRELGPSHAEQNKTASRASQPGTRVLVILMLVPTLRTSTLNYLETALDRV